MIPYNGQTSLTGSEGRTYDLAMPKQLAKMFLYSGEMN